MYQSWIVSISTSSAAYQNRRLTNLDLAEAVGLSPSPCLSRLRRLEGAGYIISYNARVQLSKLVEHITVFTEVTLNDHKREDFIKFELETRRYEALQECHMISGGYDYLLKFVIRNVARYQELMEAILERNIGVEKYFSYIVIKTIIDRGSVPIKSLTHAS